MVDYFTSPHAWVAYVMACITITCFITLGPVIILYSLITSCFCDNVEFTLGFLDMIADVLGNMNKKYGFINLNKKLKLIK